jgi:hypothetical protein
MASSIGSSISSIDKLDEYEQMLCELKDQGVFLDCQHSMSTKNLTSLQQQSDKSTSCSTRSSSCISLVCDSTSNDHYVTFECFSDEEKKQPDSSSSACESDDDNGMPGVQEFALVINEVAVRKENICRARTEQKKKSSTFYRSYCSGTCLIKYLGVFLFFFGTWLCFGSFSYKKLISDATKRYVEGPIPIYLSCSAVSSIFYIFLFLEVYFLLFYTDLM